MRHFRSPLDVFKGEEKHPVTLPELLSSSAAAALRVQVALGRALTHNSPEVHKASVMRKRMEEKLTV